MARISRAERLIKRYEQARGKIEGIILQEQEAGNPILYYQAVLRKIERELARLRKEVANEIEKLAREEYEKAVRRAVIVMGLDAAIVAVLLSGHAERPTEGFARPGIPTIQEIIFDKQQEAMNALQTVGRQINDATRMLSMEAVGGYTANLISGKEAQQRLAAALLGADGIGLGGVEYKNGSVMPFDKYSQMVVRSTRREAANTGTVETALFGGSALVKLTSHWPTCHICAPRQGRVYRLTDFPEEDERNAFPTIDKAFPGWPTYANIHPNCRHSIIPLPSWDYISADERKRYLEDANKPFDTDPRAEAEIKAYNQEQEAKRRKNADARQYVRYKAVLGDNMPTFSGWRRMKKANSERYQELRGDYRYALKIIKKERIIQTGHGGLPMRGDPGQIKDLVRPDGRIMQRRIYGDDGRATLDFDNTNHHNQKTHPISPHAHDWDYQKDEPRQHDREMTPEEIRRNEDLQGGDD